MQIRSKLVISLFSILGVVACGDDDSGGTGGVSGNKKVGDLSDDEAKAVCKGIQGKLTKLGDANVELVCVGTGLAVSLGNADMCETSAASCRETESTADFMIDCDGTDGQAGGVPPGCEDVTVGDLTACLDATVSLVQSAVQKITCSTPLSELTKLNTSVKPPEACTKLGGQCGNFLAN